LLNDFILLPALACRVGASAIQIPCLVTSAVPAIANSKPIGDVGRGSVFNVQETRLGACDCDFDDACTIRGRIARTPAAWHEAIAVLRSGKAVSWYQKLQASLPSVIYRRASRENGNASPPRICCAIPKKPRNLAPIAATAVSFMAYTGPASRQVCAAQFSGQVINILLCDRLGNDSESLFPEWSLPKTNDFFFPSLALSQ